MKDETNHIFYETWRDRGGNIGIQCTFEHVHFPVTFWTGKEKLGTLYKDPKLPELGEVECTNCQAIVKSNIRQSMQDVHNNEKEGDDCTHRPSQP
jgi:hypothetical protein